MALVSITRLRLRSWSFLPMFAWYVLRSARQASRADGNLVEWCDEAAVVHWTQESAVLPTWPEAYQRLQKDGRRSKVNHPSAGHQAYEFPPPPVNPRGELPFK